MAVHGSLDPAKPNFLFMTGDDMWAGELEMYGIDPGNNEVPTEFMTNWMTPRGVVFNRAYSKPLCSPSRASFNTGIYGFHTGNGVGDLAEHGNRPLPLSATTIGKVMSDAGYKTAAIGKWHLSSEANGLFRHPVLAGYDFWTGSLRNIVRPDEDYYHWKRGTAWKTEKGVAYKVDQIDDYVTKVTIDDAIDWLQTVDNEPFFLNLNFNTPHSPRQVPPAGTYDDLRYVIGPGQYEGLQLDRFKAMIQNMDFEMRRLTEWLQSEVLANTHLVFVGDNGSDIIRDPWPQNHVKRTCYEPGIRVPMIWVGPTVDLPGRKYDHWFQFEDFLPTVADIAGIDLAATYPAVSFDGVSYKTALTSRSTGEIRDRCYTEAFAPNGANTGASRGGIRCIQGVFDTLVLPPDPSEKRFKLMRFVTGTTFPDATDEMYNLDDDPVELTNLIPGGNTGGLTTPELNAYNALVSSFTTLVNS